MISSCPVQERSDRMKRVLAAAAAAVLISTVVYAQSDEEKIRARAQEFADAWNKHDPTAMAYFWSVDGDLINPSGRKASGLTEIQRLFADEHGQNGPMKQSTYKSVSAKIRFLEPTLALLDQDIEISGITAPDGSMVTQKSHVAALLRKSGGQWWINSVRAYNYLPPPPPPAPK